jgi:hypothetical protein
MVTSSVSTMSTHTVSHLIRGVCLSEYTGSCVDDEDEDVVVEDDKDDTVRGNDFTQGLIHLLLKGDCHPKVLVYKVLSSETPGV